MGFPKFLVIFPVILAQVQVLNKRPIEPTKSQIFILFLILSESSKKQLSCELTFKQGFSIKMT